jgi:hypothetical protein
MRYFCTYFDSGYFTRGMALYESLRQHCPVFTLWVLCLDEISLDELNRRNLPGVKLISPEELERATEGLAQARTNRSRVEYYFTCSPALPLFILKTVPQVDLITYLDSDLYFYADPECVFEELGTGSIGIIRHRFKPELAAVEQPYGIYNVGWVTFRRDEEALACLRWWRDRCIEWCFHRLEENRYADQKYLDYFPEKFRNVVVLEHKGANLAPWNIANYRISRANNQITVDGQPLLFFHFHGFRQINRLCYTTGLGKYKSRTHRSVLRAVFHPYITTLLEFAREGTIPAGLVYRQRRRSGPAWKRLLCTLRDLARAVGEHFSGARILYLFGRTF